MNFRINLLITIIFSLLLFSSCRKDDANQEPTCSITFPENNSQIPYCTLLKIFVISEDINGKIVEVKILVDNIEQYSESNNPNNFEWVWNTNNFNLGLHEIEAIAKDNNGTQISDKIKITLIDNPPPQANFSIDMATVTIWESIKFTDLSTNNPTSWLWDFGDNNTSPVQNPEHEYGNFGEFTVSLTVTNACGSDIKTTGVSL